MALNLVSSQLGRLVEFTSTVTIPVTISGTNTYLLVKAGYPGASDVLSGMTFNGVAVPRVKDSTFTGSPASAAALIHGLVNPPAGTFNLVVNSSSAFADMAIIVEVWEGVDQATPIGNTYGGNAGFQGSPKTQAVSISAGNVCSDAITLYTPATALTAGGSQTQTQQNTGSPYKCRFAGSYQASAATMSWTFGSGGTEQCGYAAIELRAASVPDTTAPTLTSPTGTATGSTTATVGATTDEGNGTLYAVVTTSATAPTKAQVKAGQNAAGSAANWSGSVAVSSTGAKTLSATGLTASTTYYAHLMHEDAATNQANVVSSTSFTTSAGASGSKGRYYYQFGSPQC